MTTIHETYGNFPSARLDIIDERDKTRIRISEPTGKASIFLTKSELGQLGKEIAQHLGAIREMTTAALRAEVLRLSDSQKHICMRGGDEREALAAACDALGDIMMALGARKMLAGVTNEVVRAKLSERLKTDAELEGLAVAAFESAATALAKAGHPGAQVFSCNPTEGA